VTVVELGAIGEFIASIAVLVTLIILTLQTRQNTIAIRRSNERQSITGDLASSLRSISENEQIADIFMKGTEDVEQLNPLERYRFDLTMVVWLQSVEQAYADYKQGWYSEDYLTVFKNAVPAVMNQPGASLWWDERKVWFSTSFRDELERLRDEASFEAATAGVRPKYDA